MRAFAFTFAVGIFFLNPAFACGPAEPEFQYDAAQMRAAVEGTWSLSITPNGGTTVRVAVRIEQGTKAPTAAAPSQGRGAVRAAHACGARTLLKPAAACGDWSEMPLAVSYFSGDPAFAAGDMSGNFVVHGLAFLSGDLSVAMAGYDIRATVSADGSLSNPTLGPGGVPGTLTMTRVP